MFAEKEISAALRDLSREVAGVRNELTSIKELLMSTVPAGLAALQALVPTIQDFATQQSTDLASLTTNITAAITALQNSNASEDPQVQIAVTALQSALSTSQANETALETLNTNLAAAVPAAGGTTGTATANAQKKS